MPYTAIYSIYRDVGPALKDCIVYAIDCHIQHIQGCGACSGGTVYAIHCHIQHIQGCRACSRGLYMPYTARYSTYRDVGPVLGDCICHTLPYTQIQGCGPCSGGLHMPYTAIYSIYRDVGPALAECICHTL